MYDAKQCNPRCEFAITLEYLQEPYNYHTMYQGTNELWLPFFHVSPSGEVKHDGLIGQPLFTHPYWRQITWSSINDGFVRDQELASLGIVPYPDGEWSKGFSIADAMAFQFVQNLLSNP